MPESIRRATWLYAASVTIPVLTNGLLGLVLALPVIAFQIFLFSKIWTGSRWARVSVLVFALYAIWREVRPFGVLFASPRPASWPIGTFDLVLAIAPVALKAVALLLLFSRSANQWFALPPSSPADENDPNGAADVAGVESKRTYQRYSSIKSTALGIGVAVAVLGTVILGTRGCATAMDGDSSDLKPGDADYPTANANPAHVVPLIVLGLDYCKGAI
jgi:hypothetical protein